MVEQQTKDELTSRLAELTERLERLKVNARKAHSGDFSEMAQERENDEVVDALGNETREEIGQIQRALSRIEDGTYGKCQRCGDEIAAPRLAIMPAATLCMKCA